ncbi:MAG: prephenate dehydratase [Rhodothermales bacterium]
MKVAFQGELGAYSEEAVLALFPDAVVHPMISFDDVFGGVESGQVEYGVIPIENSLFGSVHVNYDLLRRHDLVIVGEWYLRIQHHLLANAGVKLADVTHVYSHPQALGQCQDFLKKHLAKAEIVPAYDTAGAAKMVAEQGERGWAAIASNRAGEKYGLDFLASGIESDHQNYTRFLALQTRPASEKQPQDFSKPEEMKTSVMYAVKENVPGALFKSLAVFALRDLDLFKIESRPLIGSPGKYVFYIDLQGTHAEDRVLRALGHLGEIAADVKVLGSYRRAIIGS